MLTNFLDNDSIKNLSHNELAILHYMYNHSDEVTAMNIREFSKAVSFSTATILRFCKKLNLSGYAELKYFLKQNNTITKTPSTAIKDTNQILKELYHDIENTSLLIKEDSVQKTMDELDSDKSIHLYGGGVSGHVLDYLEKLLFSFGRQKVYRYEASNLGYHIANTLTKKDILIAISSSGEFEPTIKIVNLAKLHDATVIAITPYTKNNIATMADINFRFFSNPRQNEGAEYTSRLPIFYIINSIFKSYLKRKENDS